MQVHTTPRMRQIKSSREETCQKAILRRKARTVTMVVRRRDGKEARRTHNTATIKVRNSQCTTSKDHRRQDITVAEEILQRTGVVRHSWGRWLVAVVWSFCSRLGCRVGSIARRSSMIRELCMVEAGRGESTCLHFRRTACCRARAEVASD
jgi:hypothetical protein